MDIRQYTSAPAPRPLRWGGLLAALLFIGLLLGGCGGVPIIAFPPSALPTLVQAMVRIETQSVDEENMTQRQVRELHTKLGFGTEQLNATAPKGASPEEKQAALMTAARARFLYGYWQEYNKDYQGALRSYQDAEKQATPYGAQAYYRAGVLGMRGVLGNTSGSVAKNSLRPLVSKHDEPNLLDRLISGAKPQKYQVLERIVPGQPLPALAGEGGIATAGTEGADTPVIVPKPMSATALQHLDTVYRTGGGVDQIYYVTVKSIVDAFRSLSSSYGPALALIFLALLVKVLTIPMTNKAFRGMRDMQRIQPYLKELQEKYKDDRAKFAEEQMRLMKEHNVSPLGGCLPMLIQLPIFIIVYNAVMVYANGFADARFLWISSLALPDFTLLVLYLISMIVSQKLTPTTGAGDPAVQQQQKIMTWFMPIFLVVVLKDFASAFVLYWLFLNIFTTIHQYYLLRQFTAEEAAAGLAPIPADNTKTTPTSSSSKKKGKRP